MSGISTVDRRANVSDKAHPKAIAMLNTTPNPGFTSYGDAIDGGRYLAVTHEAITDTVLISEADHFVRSSTLREISFSPLPRTRYSLRGGGGSGRTTSLRNVPDEPAFNSDSLVIGSFFTAGVRIYDVSNVPVRAWSPGTSPGSGPPVSNVTLPDNTIQINDVSSTTGA